MNISNNTEIPQPAVEFPDVSHFPVCWWYNQAEAFSSHNGSNCSSPSGFRCPRYLALSALSPGAAFLMDSLIRSILDNGSDAH